MTGCTVRRYDQLETSPETIEQELRPEVCERRQTDRLVENYSIDMSFVSTCDVNVGPHLANKIVSTNEGDEHDTNHCCKLRRV